MQGGANMVKGGQKNNQHNFGRLEPSPYSSLYSPESMLCSVPFWNQTIVTS